MSTKFTGKHAEVTEKILKAYFTVYRTLGYGFVEKVYRNALAYEGQKLGMKVEVEKRILVYYEGVVVGEFYADLVFDNVVIVEIKTLEALLPEHEAQLLNYLKATLIEVGLLLNFGPKVEYKRKVFDNLRKRGVSSNQ